MWRLDMWVENSEQIQKICWLAVWIYRVWLALYKQHTFSCQTNLRWNFTNIISRLFTTSVQLIETSTKMISLLHFYTYSILKILSRFTHITIRLFKIQQLAYLIYIFRYVNLRDALLTVSRQRMNICKPFGVS